MIDNLDGKTIVEHNSGQTGPCYFSHIPKTGGTSFTTIIDRFFAVDNIFEQQLWWEVGDIEKIRQQNYRCIRGHFGVGAQSLSREKLRTFTILRHPVRMAYSTYQYIKREANTKTHDYVTENNLSFEDFLTDPATENLTKNRMVKSLSFGLGLEHDVTGLVVTPKNYKLNRKAWNANRKTMNPKELLNLMKLYLDECVWFGLLEEFELSLSMLSYQMSWPPIGPTSRLNSHNKQPQISKKAIRLVEELNSLDIEFYQYAKIKFDQQVEAFYQRIDVNRVNLASIDQLVDENYQLHRSRSNTQLLTEGISFDFSQVLLGKNWHRREWNPEENMYFRWTGPAIQTSIDFWLKPAKYKVSISFVNIVDIKLFNNLEIQINGIPVDWSKKHKGNKGEITFECSYKLIKENGLLRLSMTSDELVIHDSVFDSKDNRKVGLAVNQIEIKKSRT